MEFRPDWIALSGWYTPYTFRKVQPKYFLKNEPDYRQEKNLLSGKGQAIIAKGALGEQFESAQYNTPDTEKRLTDGVLAERATYTDPAWVRFSRGISRDVIFDLGAIGAVREFRIRMLNENATAVRLPRRIGFAVSENGVDFATVAELVGLKSERDSDIVTAAAKLEPAVRARFLRVRFDCAVHVYIDQIEAIGKKDAADAVTPEPDKEEENRFPNKFCDKSQLGGAKDVVLAYFCDRGAKPLTAEQLKPYVGYLDADGKAKDTLFDGYLFLPYVCFLYEKGKKRPLQKEDWQFYMDEQFLQGKNLDALEEAASQVASELDMPELKVKVFFSLLYPVPEQHAFGELGGRTLDFALPEDRFAALQWLIDEQERRFAEKNYRHIDLSGYYWFTEEINYGDEQLLKLIRDTTDYVRSKGLITTWIPYYLASGYDDWRNLGFDMACYQPNYAFRQDIPEKRLFDAAQTARVLGMCIELEVGGTEPWNVGHTRNYYAAGAVTRYMQDAAHIYYQCGMPGAFYRAYHSGDPYLHSMYDDTYRFIKGTYPADGFAEGAVLPE